MDQKRPYRVLLMQLALSEKIRLEKTTACRVMGSFFSSFACVIKALDNPPPVTLGEHLIHGFRQSTPTTSPVLQDQIGVLHRKDGNDSRKMIHRLCKIRRWPNVLIRFAMGGASTVAYRSHTLADGANTLEHLRSRRVNH